MMKANPRVLTMTTSVAALMLAGVSIARAEEVDHSKMDHSGHGAAAPLQWVDPGKAQGAAPADAAKPADAPKADADHSKHEGMDHGAMGHGGMNGSMGGMDHSKGGGMSGMDHGKAGGMGGMGGMMGGMGGMSGMNHGGSGSGMDHGGGGMGGMMKGMICGFAEHLEGRIAYMKAELKLTDTQTGAWNTFADAWRAAAQTAQQKCAAADSQKMDHAQPAVLHKLGMMESHMTGHLEVIRAQKAAIEPLFNALSDEQKKIASDAFSSIMKVGMSMGGGMGGGGMGGGGMGGMQH